MSFFKFRKRIKVLPGLWINLSKKGMSLSAGGKGFTVNSRGRSTVSLPGTGLSYVFSSKKKVLDIPDRVQKEANIFALWDKYTADTDKIKVWSPPKDATPAQVEEHLALLRSNRSTLQEDYDAWRAATDSYLAEIKPLGNDETYQRFSGHKQDELKIELFANLSSLENLLYQAKEQVTPIDVKFKITENAAGPPQFRFITPNGEGIMDMFGNVLSITKSNALFPAETEKVQAAARENKDGFVDKMKSLWAEAHHAKAPADAAATLDTAVPAVESETANEEQQPSALVESAQPPLLWTSTESKPKPTTSPRYFMGVLLAVLVIAIFAKIVSPNSNAPLNQTPVVNNISAPTPLKESDEQIRAENDKVFDALPRRSVSTSSQPDAGSDLRPKNSDEQIRVENDKILHALQKAKHHASE